MTPILETLPGITLPVAEVNRQLGQMWQPGREGSGAPSEFRASQMNFILHFGLQTTVQDARARFEEAIHFSQRYPCRIIVLCPEEENASDRFLEAKLFAQCYIGNTPRTMCCCEALMLGYPPNEKGDLQNQISIWLESDLPTCHWFHRVPSERISDHYLSFTRGAKHILFDSSVEHTDFCQLPWKNPSRVKDLASARLLPIRQSVGQYLSGFPPEALAAGVKGIKITHGEPLSGEAYNLSAWMKQCLETADPNLSLNEELTPLKGEPDRIFGEWVIENSDHQFAFDLRFSEGRGLLTAKFDDGSPTDWPFKAHLLPPRDALSEAVFF
ncbi:MAG: glucose-6-phosphate dehydrogenase assembly protein OpcA [Verrucomicrobiota bacterium]